MDIRLKSIHGSSTLRASRGSASARVHSANPGECRTRLVACKYEPVNTLQNAVQSRVRGELRKQRAIDLKGRDMHPRQHWPSEHLRRAKTVQCHSDGRLSAFFQLVNPVAYSRQKPTSRVPNECFGIKPLILVEGASQRLAAADIFRAKACRRPPS